MGMEYLSEKSFFDHGPANSVAHFGRRSYSSWWNSNEPQAGQLLQKGGVGSKSIQADQLLQRANHLGLQLPEQEVSSTQSPGQSCREMSVVGGVNSHDQSSSESGQDESRGRRGKAENKPFFLFGSSEKVFGGSQADQAHQTVPVSYLPAGDPYIGGGFVPVYGPLALLQGSQAGGISSARVPLPFTFAEDDGPIFVNVKQYHGIIRRRQSRAKLEAQNKLVKARKPYLHESRHRHALNRVRGSGGRFLRTKKKLQEMNPGNNCLTNARKGLPNHR